MCDRGRKLKILILVRGKSDISTLKTRINLVQEVLDNHALVRKIERASSIEKLNFMRIRKIK